MGRLYASPKNKQFGKRSDSRTLSATEKRCHVFKAARKSMKSLFCLNSRRTDAKAICSMRSTVSVSKLKNCNATQIGEPRLECSSKFRAPSWKCIDEAKVNIGSEIPLKKRHGKSVRFADDVLLKSLLASYEERVASKKELWQIFNSMSDAQVEAILQTLPKETFDQLFRAVNQLGSNAKYERVFQNCSRID